VRLFIYFFSFSSVILVYFSSCDLSELSALKP